MEEKDHRAQSKADSKEYSEDAVEARDAKAEAKGGGGGGGGGESKGGAGGSGSSSSLAARDAKAREIELEEEEDVELEFAALMSAPREGQALLAADPAARQVAMGLKIKSMNMKDGRTGALVWQSTAFGEAMFERTMEEQVPRSILKCRTVSREIVFSSVEAITNFRLEQRVFLHGKCIEEWFFTFGFVIPGSTNTWQQIIEAAPPSEMLPVEVRACS